MNLYLPDFDHLETMYRDWFRVKFRLSRWLESDKSMIWAICALTSTLGLLEQYSSCVGTTQSVTWVTLRMMHMQSWTDQKKSSSHQYRNVQHARWVILTQFPRCHHQIYIPICVVKPLGLNATTIWTKFLPCHTWHSHNLPPNPFVLFHQVSIRLCLSRQYLHHLHLPHLPPNHLAQEMRQARVRNLVRFVEGKARHCNLTWGPCRSFWNGRTNEILRIVNDQDNSSYLIWQCRWSQTAFEFFTLLVDGIDGEYIVKDNVWSRGCHDTVVCYLLVWTQKRTWKSPYLDNRVRSCSESVRLEGQQVKPELTLTQWQPRLRSWPLHFDMLGLENHCSLTVFTFFQEISYQGIHLVLWKHLRRVHRAKLQRPSYSFPPVNGTKTLLQRKRYHICIMSSGMTGIIDVCKEWISSPPCYLRKDSPVYWVIFLCRTAIFLPQKLSCIISSRVGFPWYFEMQNLISLLYQSCPVTSSKLLSRFLRLSLHVGLPPS